MFKERDRRSIFHFSTQVKRFQTLISLMLSSQTKDQITFSAMNRLKEYGCYPENLMNSSEKTIGQLIYPVGFWKVFFLLF